MVASITRFFRTHAAAFRRDGVRKYVSMHKMLTLFTLLVLVGGGYGIVKAFSSENTETQYVLAAVERGNLISNVTGSGQITASDQIDVTPEVSGTLTYIGVTAGQEVKKGDTIARLDTADAVRTLNNAEITLSNAKISYDKALKRSKNQAADSNVSDIKKAQEDGYKAVSNSFIDLPSILLGLNDIYYNPSNSPYFADSSARLYAGEEALEYKYEAGVIFDQARAKYDGNFKSYRNLKSPSDQEALVRLLNETYDTLKVVSAALTGTYNAIDYINTKIDKDIPTQIASDKSKLSGYITKVNSSMSSIQTALTSLEDAGDSVVTAELDLKSAQLSVSQAQAAYEDAQEALANHTVRAQFDGVIAKTTIERGDKVTTGTTLATLITKKKVAEISLNEIDAAKIKIGQKASLTLDAIDGLVLEGTVTDSDLIGTVSQGVVSYNIEIAFNAEDERIKTGMTVSASVTTDTRENVLLVPSAAVKSQGAVQYVEVLGSASGSLASGTSTSPRRMMSSSTQSGGNGGMRTMRMQQGQTGSVGVTGTPQRVEVQLGVSNDESSEIISGLKEGDLVVVRTISASQTTQSSSAVSLFGSGARTSGGNTVRMLR